MAKDSASDDLASGRREPAVLGAKKQPAYAGRSPLIAVASVVLITAFAFLQAGWANRFPDFFIYRLGSEIGLRGESPYDTAKVRERVADQFPDDADFIDNCGFFLPPQAMVVFAPFALVDYPTAKFLWAAVVGLSAAASLLLLRTFGTAPPVTFAGRAIPLFLLLNFLTLGVVIVGQTTLLCVGCIAAGQWCFERKRSLFTLLGAVLWAVPFVKPHVALPLLPLAWYLGGWKRAVAVAGAVAALNLIGCVIAGGSPLFLREYLEFLAAGHKTVVFNLARENYEITSWNRLLYALTESSAGDHFLVEQTAWTTLAGYLVWFGLVVGRVALAGVKPSAAWAAAAAAAGMVVVPQVLGYEALMLAVAVPWVRELFHSRLRLRALAAVAVLGLEAAVSFQMAHAVGFNVHRPLATALFALLVLVGPIQASGRREPAVQ